MSPRFTSRLFLLPLLNATVRFHPGIDTVRCHFLTVVVEDQAAPGLVLVPQAVSAGTQAQR